MKPLQMQHSSSLPPERMTPEQRVSEIAQILARGIIRLRESNAKKHPETNIVLDSERYILLAISAEESVHGDRENRNV